MPLSGSNSDIRRLKSIVNQWLQNPALDNARRGPLIVSSPSSETVRFTPGARHGLLLPVPSVPVTGDAEVEATISGSVGVVRQLDTTIGWFHNLVTVSENTVGTWYVGYNPVSTMNSPEMALLIQGEAGSGPVSRFILGYGDQQIHSGLALNAIWFEVTNGNWFANTMAAGTPTNVDTGVALRTDRPQEMYIVVAEASQVQFWIDGAEVERIITNVPVNTVSLTPQVSVDSDGSGAVAISFFHTDPMIGLSSIGLR